MTQETTRIDKAAPLDPGPAAVSIRHLTKSYKIYTSSFERALAPFRKKDTAQRFVALKDLTLDFPEGEAIAILGKNGSGKSTLLKIITGVVSPTKGEVEVKGRISAMLELTSGFDAELTGIENIYLRALALGIPEEEIDKTKDEIIAFADIGDHINQPVRTYSSGMKARLGFAVSANVDPDILIVDEVLAVGDDIFKLRCTEKMAEFRRAGKTILFVSHSLHTVKAFCTRALWLKEGVMQNYGEMGPIVQEYEDYLRAEKAREREEALAELEEADVDMPLEKDDIIHVGSFRMFNAEGKKTNVFKAGEDMFYEFDYEVKRPIDELKFCYTVRNAENMAIFISDKRDARAVIDSALGTHHVRVHLRLPFMLAGEYKLSGELWGDETFERGYANKRSFFVAQDNYIGTGIVRIGCALEVDDVQVME